MGEVLNQKARAVRALEKAWQANPRSTGVAIRLAHYYTDRKEPLRTAQVLQSALDRNPDDWTAHLETAKHLISTDASRTELINQHLARSYTMNDNNHDARHLHAQFLFLIGRAGEAWSLFQVVDAVAPADFRQRASESIISARLPRYQGTIDAHKATMAFIKSSAYPASIFAHASNTKPEIWASLRAAATFPSTSASTATDLWHSISVHQTRERCRRTAP